MQTYISSDYVISDGWIKQFNEVDWTSFDSEFNFYPEIIFD